MDMAGRIRFAPFLEIGSAPAARWIGRRACGRQRGSLTGRNPVDRGKAGSKIHVLPDANGISLVTAMPGAHVYGNVMLRPLIRAMVVIRSRPPSTRAAACRHRL